MEQVIRQSCEPFASLLGSLPPAVKAAAREIRVRVRQPVRIVGLSETVVEQGGRPFCPTQREVEALLMAFCGRSPYAHEEQIAAGFLTLDGGHRVGLCGHAVLRDGALKRLDAVQGMNIRIARQLPMEKSVLPGLLRGRGIYNSLIISPPGLGKTTLLRALCLELSQRGMQVALIDERGELAAMVKGEPQMDVGQRTDVLEGCPKKEAIPLLIRAMAPDVLITDELGSQGDAEALAEASRCGVSVVASAHGQDVEDALKRPMLKGLEGYFRFERFVVLGGSPGKLLGVYDGGGRLCRFAS